MNKVLLFTFIILSSLAVQSCSDCYDTDIPYEGFDFAIVNQLKENLVGPNARYEVEDIHFEVNGQDIIRGNYIKDGIQFFIVDYSKLSSSDDEAKIFISEASFLEASFSLKRVSNHCFPHAEMDDLMIEGNLYEIKEELFIIQ